MRLFSIVCILALSLSFSSSVFSKTAEGFTKHFQIIRDSNGKLIGIRDRTMPVKFEVKPFVDLVKNQIVEEKKLMDSSSFQNYENDVVALLDTDESEQLSAGEYQTRLEKVIEALKNLATLNVEEIFSHPHFKEVLLKFEEKMTKALYMLDPTMLAKVDDPTYFYTKNVTYKAVTWGLDFAKKRLSNIPILNTASYVIVAVEKKITERRAFHQNLLLHYLENFSEEELGLTHDEVNLVWSSIYESRISWFSYWESKNARANWDKYGVEHFYQSYRLASAKMRSSAGLYTEVGERVNYAFQNVTYKNEKVVINLFDNEAMFINRPSVAFSYDRPTSIARKRVLLSLAQLGLSFVPLNGTMKSGVENFIKSFYENQRLTEGALYGLFESTKDERGMLEVKRQYLNPFDTML